jgi:molybdenum cofactor synthesis domain-containing protein
MPLVSLDEARRHVLDRCAPLGVVEMPLADALGAVVSHDCVASAPMPPFANTAMDGFAVRSADVVGAAPESPVRLRVVETILAGASPTQFVGKGEAARIMTGAPMPEGADAVVMLERTTAIGPDAVDVDVEVAPGLHVRGVGDDIRPGDVVVRRGDMLTAARVGVLAEIGTTDVPVHRRPRVGVVSTGDELVADGGPLAAGQIRDSNRPALLASLRASGFDAVDLGLVPDDESAITDAIERGATECDALLTSGGVSMGDVDLVKVVLAKVAEMRWMQIAIRPAKPFAFGVVERDGRSVPVFGLPGNPVSSLVSFELLARPALRQMAGHAQLDRPHVEAIADEAFERRPDGKTHFARVLCTYIDGAYCVRSAGGQGSHQLAAMANADGLAVLPDGDGVPEGGIVEVMLLSR